MRKIGTAAACCLLVAIASAPGALGQWVGFEDGTATRLSAADDVGSDDVAEKDYAWGDLDNDGDIDLVVVRKEPWGGLGKRRNVLLLNEGGVLVDRTVELASTSDVASDEGFLTPTNDRDVQIADVDLDGWLDVVVAASYSDFDPKPIGHPRVYINLGQDEANGDWLGLRYEEARIPLLISVMGTPDLNPRFSSVAVGDVTGDGYPDLWFGQDVTSGVQAFGDRLLVNQGPVDPGVFVDETAVRISGTNPANGDLFYESVRTPAVAVADMNNDGQDDLLRAPPGYVALAYNDGVAPGFFDEDADVPQFSETYFVSAGDLNNDALLDLVITDYGADRYLLNQGDGPVPSFTASLFDFYHDGAGGPSSDEAFGGNSLVADLNNDGWNDVLITDVDLEIPGCNRRMHLYRNLGGIERGGDVVLQEVTNGVGCQSFQGNPASCLVAGIPSDQLEGVHDVAVFDIDGDGWKDMILGRCSGTDVWMNVPPTPAGGVPDGDALPGIPLTAARQPNGRIVLEWGDSCLPGDADYEVYAGAIGDFASHAPLACSTSGATTRLIVPGPGSEYYLVVPSNGTWEGSYGRTSAGLERPASASACRPRAVGSCEE